MPPGATQIGALPGSDELEIVDLLACLLSIFLLVITHGSLYTGFGWSGLINKAHPRVSDSVGKDFLLEKLIAQVDPLTYDERSPAFFVSTKPQ